VNNYRSDLPSDVPGYHDEPMGGMWLSDASRSAATMDAEHRAGLHAADPCGDCSLCEPSGLEQQGDPFTAHVERRFGAVDPWLASGQLLDLALGGELHGAGGLQGDLVGLRHRHAESVNEPITAEQCHSVVGAR
jgi:hypothetical protein